jgi:hypothetical protein
VVVNRVERNKLEPQVVYYAVVSVQTERVVEFFLERKAAEAMKTWHVLSAQAATASPPTEAPAS